MELIILMGIPGSGKSTFYKEKYFNTHMRISLDLLNTRNKMTQFMSLAYSLQQRMVLDNTNTTKVERSEHIQEAKAKQFSVKGYYFESKLSVCLERNDHRMGKDKINRAGVIAKYNMLQMPSRDEGFDELYYVRIENDQFLVNSWNNEI